MSTALLQLRSLTVRAGRIVLRTDPYNDPEGQDTLEFRLTYDGILLSSSGKITRASHKHDIRKVFHPQLKRLWGINPHLLEYRPRLALNMVELKLDLTGRPEKTRIERLADNSGCEDFRLAPLVTEELE